MISVTQDLLAGEKLSSISSDVTEISISNTRDDYAQVDHHEYDVTRVVEFIEGFHGSTVTLFVDADGYFTGEYAQACHPCIVSGRFDEHENISGTWTYANGNGSGSFHLIVNGPVSYTGTWTFDNEDHDGTWLWVKPRLTWYLRTFDVVTAFIGLFGSMFVLTIQFYESLQVFGYASAAVNFFYACICSVVVAQYLHWFYPGHATTFGMISYVVGYIGFIIPNVFQVFTIPCLWIGTLSFVTGNVLLTYAFYPSKNSPKSLVYAFYGAVEFLIGSLVLLVYCFVVTFTSWYNVSKLDIRFTLNVLCICVSLLGRVHFLASAIRGYYVLDKPCVPMITSFGWRHVNYDSSMIPLTAPAGYSTRDILNQV